jgi:hypothetical protein
MQFLTFPEYVGEKAHKRHDLWIGLGGLALNIAFVLLPALFTAVWQVGITARSASIASVVVLAVLAPTIAMLRWGFRAKRVSRSAERFADLQKENGLRLAFEWTAIKSADK